MKTMRSAVLMMVLWLLATGCERRGWADGDADFSNTAGSAVDIFRNDRRECSLGPGTHWECRAEHDDSFAVRQHSTGTLLGTYRMDISGDIVESHLCAIICDDRVDWSVSVETASSTFDTTDSRGRGGLNTAGWSE